MNSLVEVVLIPALDEAIGYIPPDGRGRRQGSFYTQRETQECNVWELLFVSYANGLFRLLHQHKEEIELFGFAVHCQWTLRKQAPEVLWALSQHPRTSRWFGQFDEIAKEALLIRDSALSVNISS